MRALIAISAAFALLMTAGSSLALVEAVDGVATFAEDSGEAALAHARETQGYVWAKTASGRDLALVGYDNAEFLARSGLDLGFDATREVLANPDGTTDGVLGDVGAKAAAATNLALFLTANFAGLTNGHVALVTAIAGNAGATASEVAALELAALLGSPDGAQVLAGALQGCAGQPDPAASAPCAQALVGAWLNGVVQA